MCSSDAPGIAALRLQQLQFIFKKMLQLDAWDGAKSVVESVSPQPLCYMKQSTRPFNIKELQYLRRGGADSIKYIFGLTHGDQQFVVDWNFIFHLLVRLRLREEVTSEGVQRCQLLYHAVVSSSAGKGQSTQLEQLTTFLKNLFQEKKIQLQSKKRGVSALISSSLFIRGFKLFQRAQEQVCVPTGGGSVYAAAAPSFEV